MRLLQIHPLVKASLLPPFVPPRLKVTELSGCSPVWFFFCLTILNCCFFVTLLPPVTTFRKASFFPHPRSVRPLPLRFKHLLTGWFFLLAFSFWADVFSLRPNGLSLMHCAKFSFPTAHTKCRRDPLCSSPNQNGRTLSPSHPSG